MTSRERIRQLYYSSGRKRKGPDNKKYLIAGAVVIVVIVLLVFVFGGGDEPPTTTTPTQAPTIDLDTEVLLIKNKLNKIVGELDDIKDSQETVTAFASRIDGMLTKIS